MEHFSMICNQPADFVSPKQELFRITEKQVGKVVEAPEWIRKTVNYRFLLNEETIVFPKGTPQEPQKGRQEASKDSERNNATQKAEGQQEPKQKSESGKQEEPVAVTMTTDKPDKVKKGEGK